VSLDAASSAISSGAKRTTTSPRADAFQLDAEELHSSEA